MIREIVIPVMDQTTESVRLASWLVKEGATVARGDVLCEVETDKATVEIEATADGILRKQLIDVGTDIPPLTIVALVGPADAPVPDDIDPYQRTSQAKPQPAPEPAAPPAAAPPSRPAEQPRRIIASPRAKRLAEDLGVDLNSVVGSGPNGRIMEDDVRRAQQLETATPEPRPAERPRRIIASPRAKRLAEELGVDLNHIEGSGPNGRILEDDVRGAATASATPAPSRLAQAKAERVSQSWQTIPHFYMSITVDLSSIVAQRASAGKQLTFTDYFALALARTLNDHPALNGHWRDGGLQLSSAVHLGIVVQTDRGLVIPVLANLQDKSLAEISAIRSEIVAQARSGKLGAASLGEPTFTISNVGPGHIDTFTAIISPPQLAILSVGSVQPRPLVIGSELVIRPSATFTLGVDHRAIDGRQSAAFLEQLKQDLESS